jgi:hypothetical protein
MLLFWKIRYLDRRTRQFNSHDLYLDTRNLDPTTRVAIELIAKDESPSSRREIFRFRDLFSNEEPEHRAGMLYDGGEFRTVGPVEYVEDENGRELSDDEIARIMSGSPTARAIPAGAKKHHIEFMLSEPKLLPIKEVGLRPEEIGVLGYFVRDLGELAATAFMKGRPGTLHATGAPPGVFANNPTLRTSASEEEIRSFVTIFRRLYMETELANFKKASAVFVTAVGDNPYGKLIDGNVKEYDHQLNGVLDARLVVPEGRISFTAKRLIDVFLYTQYAHQPDSCRQRQFDKCLTQVSGKRELLTWLFLTTIWKLAREILCSGNVISWWFGQYCKEHNVQPAVLDSLAKDHLGFGAEETDDRRRRRLFAEAVTHLANDLWQRAGQPAGGANQFLDSARQQLTERLKA